jgi:hypothetical protein
LEIAVITEPSRAITGTTITDKQPAEEADLFSRHPQAQPSQTSSLQKKRIYSAVTHSDDQ